MRKGILAAAVAAAVLTGCAATTDPEVRVVEVRPEVPASLLSCQPEPEPPESGTQRDVARFVLDLAEAGADCRGKLNAVRGMLDEDRAE
jgi:hypothetical protein